VNQEKSNYRAKSEGKVRYRKLRDWLNESEREVEKRIREGYAT